MNDEPLWYCLRTKPRYERRTSHVLRTELGLEVFCPYVRFERARRTGRVWVCEAMFPAYVFARFPYISQHRLIRAARGVTKVVEFGGVPSVVSPEIIEELRRFAHDEETVVIPTHIEPGEEVDVITGPFRGVRAIVTRVVPARQRVAILLDLLGMEREVEVAASAVLPDVRHPMDRQGRRKASHGES
jgi:transcriptional antiterminator RfaH